MNRMTDLSSDSGMTRIQLLILTILAIVIIGLSLPPFLKDRKVSQADVDVETISKAIKKALKSKKPKSTLLLSSLNTGIPTCFEVLSKPIKDQMLWMSTFNGLQIASEITDFKKNPLLPLVSQENIFPLNNAV